jgi:outer membrane lipoprotein-sorting protein
MGLPYLLAEKKESALDQIKIKAYDFKSGAAEKVGERDAKVVRYRCGQGDGCPGDEEITLWIDAKTLLPLKRSFVLKRDGVRIVENYTEFTLEPKVDAKDFDLPSDKVHDSSEK